ncbi:hypothetical protein Acr_00g0086470 [Actinidia rufa]|uniref:Uncharacterized protein n=1 Tax=Actinidia rufa TaxID=165716 RepID=A0A7J0DWE7_9ERIC|nr:hypothetical protein Acr_00g0086470 [Actinidia rufa]
MAPGCKNSYAPSSSIDLSDEVNQITVKLQRLKEEAKGTSTNSSSSSSLIDLLGNEEEEELKEGEEVKQVIGEVILALPVMDPFLISSNEEGPADLKLPSFPPAFRNEDDHCFVGELSFSSSSYPKKDKGKAPDVGHFLASINGEGQRVGSVSTSTPNNAPKLWTPKFIVIELGRQVTTADTSQDHDFCLALVQPIMLPKTWQT